MTILGTTEYGIRADSTVENLVIACNYLSGWTGKGVLLEKSAAPQLYYNTAVSPAEQQVVGIHLRDVTGALAKDNIIWNRGLDSSACYRIDGVFPFASGASDYNDLHVSGAGGSTARVNDTWYAGLADWRGHSSAPDGRSLAQDPLFDSVGDFHIEDGSPCRHAGTPIAGIATDLDGDARDTLAPDIGADEYTPGAVEEVLVERGQARLSIRPNPFVRFVTVRYSLAEPAQVRLSIIDVTGRTVLAPGAHRRGPGSFDEVLDLGVLGPGVYVLRLVAGSLVASAKLVKQ